MKIINHEITNLGPQITESTTFKIFDFVFEHVEITNDKFCHIEIWHNKELIFDSLNPSFATSLGKEVNELIGYLINSPFWSDSDRNSDSMASVTSCDSLSQNEKTTKADIRLDNNSVRV